MAVGWYSMSKPIASSMFFVAFSVITFVANIRREKGRCSKWTWWSAFVAVYALTLVPIAAVIGHYDTTDKGIVGPLLLVTISGGMTLAGRKKATQLVIYGVIGIAIGIVSMIVYALVAGIKAAIAWLVWDFLVASLTMVVPKAASMHTSYKAFFVLCDMFPFVAVGVGHHYDAKEHEGGREEKQVYMERVAMKDHRKEGGQCALGT
jgi:hypothetical protein